MKNEVAKEFAEIVGPVCNGEKKVAEIIKSKFARYQVEIDVYEPIIRGCYLKLRNADVFWIDFKYEKLPSLCSKCDAISHMRDKCRAEVKERMEGKEGHEEQIGNSPCRNSEEAGTPVINKSSGGANLMEMMTFGREVGGTRLEKASKTMVSMMEAERSCLQKEDGRTAEKEWETFSTVLDRYEINQVTDRDEDEAHKPRREEVREGDLIDAVWMNGGSYGWAGNDANHVGHKRQMGYFVKPNTDMNKPKRRSIKGKAERSVWGQEEA